MRILQIPCNTPYVRKLHDGPRFSIVNGTTFGRAQVIPAEITFQFMLEHAFDSAFWNSFDIAHIHYGFELEPHDTVAEALGLISDHGKPIVYTYHEPHSMHGADDSPYQRLLTLIASQASGIITLTAAAQQDLQRIVPDSRPAVIAPHGYALNPDNPYFCRDRSQETDARVLLYSSIRRNRDLVTSTTNLLMGAVPGTRTTLLTRPAPNAEALKELSALLTLAFTSPHGTVSFELPLSDDDLAQRISTMDILVLPYLYAGHSGALEMAFDTGLLPVITNVGYLSYQCEIWDQLAPTHVAADWSDEKPWAYQQRLMAAVKEAVAQLQEFRASLDPDARRRYRREEHLQILRTHNEVYRAALAA
ncbi:MAG TPA: glycosyltransferase [Candidatus Saccharimonadia bacterium]|jgi:hypothetical protein